MDSYNNAHHELDSVMGTMTRIPRLTSADGFSEWKFRIENHMRLTNFKLWRSMIQGPVKITITDPTLGLEIDKPLKDYTDADFEKIESDSRALGILTLALTPEIAQGFRGYTCAKSLFDALVAVYEGNDDMKQSRHDLLR